MASPDQTNRAQTAAELQRFYQEQGARRAVCKLLIITDDK